MKCTFRQFSADDLARFRAWLNEPHISPFWQETDDDDKLRIKFLHELSARGVHAFIIEWGGEAIGYIQYYEAVKVGGGWWPNELPGVFGIDLMIGSRLHVVKGLSSGIIREFIGFIGAREKHVDSFIIDPSPENPRALRAFERAGFRREAEISTPGGPAVLMRMKLRPVEKVLAYITRENGESMEVLVFDQDNKSSGTQIPGGTVDDGEDLVTACLREVHEESGLVLQSPRLLGRWGWIRNDRAELHLRNVYQIESGGLPEEWIHAAEGSSEENGLKFHYFWMNSARAESELAADQGKYLGSLPRSKR